MDKTAFLTKFSTAKVKQIELEDGTILHIRKLSQAEVEQSHKRYSRADSNAVESLRFAAAHGLVSEQGERIFGDDLTTLAVVEFDALSQIAAEVAEYSGMTKREKKA